jgi:integrase
MSLDYAVDDCRLIAKNPAARTKFPPMRRTTHTYLTAREVADLAEACGDQGDVVLILAYSGLRFGELTGLNVEDVDVEARRIRVRRSITQVGGRPVEGNPKSDAGRRSVPIPERLVPALKARLDNRPRGAPAITSPRGSRLGLENWKRSVNWKTAITKIGRDKMRVHDLRHTYASLSRRAGADLRLLQKAMGHASITVTAHTYADLFDDELDNIAAALDSLDDLSQST